MADPYSETAAAGVRDLIDRIRDDGVKAGREQADEIVHDARREAASILAAAKSEAQQLVEDAHKKIESERKSSEESLKLAARDTIKELGQYVRHAFRKQMERFVSAQFEDRDFLRQIILTLAGQTAEEVVKDRAIEVLLNESINGGAGPEVSDNAEAEQRLKEFILGVSSELLREGIEFRLDPHVESGVSVRIVDEDIRIDISDATISEFLVRNLLPRYRRIIADES